jgi:hypothetical protein
MDIATNLFLLASPLGVESYLSHHLAEKRQIDVGVGLYPTYDCRSIRLMHLTTYCYYISSKVWTKCSLWATARDCPYGSAEPVGDRKGSAIRRSHRSRFTAKYPPKRRKGWFSRVVCRVRNLPFLSATVSIEERKRTNSKGICLCRSCTTSYTERG